MEFRSKVGDEEVLYRSIRSEQDEGECILQDGKYEVTSQAFTDRSRCPSVYRHCYCEDPPHSNPPRLGETQGVISFTAFAVRRLSVSHAGQGFIVDVIAEPNSHIAHAIITTEPPLTERQKDAFRKLRHALQNLNYEWAIQPNPIE